MCLNNLEPLLGILSACDGFAWHAPSESGTLNEDDLPEGSISNWRGTAPHPGSRRPSNRGCSRGNAESALGSDQCFTDGPIAPEPTGIRIRKSVQDRMIRAVTQSNACWLGCP